MGTGVGHAEVGHRERDGFGGHRSAAIGVERERADGDLVLRADVGDEAFGERRLPLMCHPRAPKTYAQPNGSVEAQR
jgi:hypothetical protein